MNIATILFTYNRSEHTKRVMEALHQNTILPQKLYIFQDGLKNEEHRKEWEKVNAFIREADFCPTEIYISEENKGLAESIVSGINYVFHEYDAVIVLEDDCVPMPGFMQFMIQCFETYKEDKNIYSVSGYAWPVSLKAMAYDAYFCGRISSWGWGTWKDRWKEYEKDYEILQRIKKTQNGSRCLALWGSDLEAQLLGRVKGENNSWAVFWALKVIEKQGLCLNPYVSLIDNIGHDGSGVHCGVSEAFEVVLDKMEKQEFRLPIDHSSMRENENAFVDLWGKHTALENNEQIEKEKVLIYGLGNFFFSKEKEINERYEIVAFIDRSKRGFYAGKEIIKPDKIDGYLYDRIFIAIQSMQESLNISKMLCTKYGILPSRIIAGIQMIYPNMNISVDFEDFLISFDGKNHIRVASQDEFNNCLEVWRDKIYSYCLCNGKQDVVIDIGMNIGDSVLWFLEKENVKKVYAYEPFESTYERARKNIYANVTDRNRYKLFQAGLSNITEKRRIQFNGDMSCGQSTDSVIRMQNYQNYIKWGLVKEENEMEEEIEVRKASVELQRIMKEYTDCNIVLKMDCEGEEYVIFDDLAETGILEQIDFIMLEWHYRGADKLIEKLEKAGFSCWNFDKDKTMGCIYALQQYGRSNE